MRSPEPNPTVLEDVMKAISRVALPVLALLASISVAQAQSEGHNAHHPGGQPEMGQSPPAPNPPPPNSGAMPMQGMPMQGMPMQGMQGMQGMGPHGMAMGGGAMGCSMMRQSQDNDSDDDSDDMSMMRMMKHDPAMGMPFEHVEGRIAFLQAEIGVTDAQRAQWNAFADALRRNAEAEKSMH